MESGDVLDLLTSLVDKSMVVADAGIEGATRYRLLETLRQYGLAPQRQLIMYFDLEALASAGVDDFWIEVLDALSTRLPGGDLATAVRHAAEAGEVRFMAVRRLLRRVRDAGFDVALCLDEFEALARNPRFEPDFYGELRSLAGELGLVYLTASKRSLYELTYEHSETLSSPFFNIFSELPLGLMNEDEARGLLAGLSSQGETALCDDEITFALGLAGTHPFFLQIAGFQSHVDSVKTGARKPRHPVPAECADGGRPGIDGGARHLRAAPVKVLQDLDALLHRPEQRVGVADECRVERAHVPGVPVDVIFIRDRRAHGNDDQGR
jgi:hypothetical protein